MVIMKEVAELAGVSTATVSRYINESGYVGKKTKIKIQEAIDELNYSPNEVARSLFQKKSKFIGLLLPDITNPFFTMLSKGVEDRLNESEYGLILGNVNGEIEKEKEYFYNFRNNNIAGIISVIEHKTNLFSDIPSVAIDRYSEQQKYSVQGDDYNGGRLAALEIIKRNPNEVFILNSIEHEYKSKLRLGGIKSVLDENNYSYHIHDVSSFGMDEVEGIIDLISNKYPKVDSVIASNDLQAMVLLKDAFNRGIKIPDDLQIIGYDNITFSSLTIPGLSTISQPIYEIGKTGADLLLKIIEGQPILEEKLILPVEFMNRESLKKIEEKVN